MDDLAAVFYNDDFGHAQRGRQVAEPHQSVFEATLMIPVADPERGAGCSQLLPSP